MPTRCLWYYPQSGGGPTLVDLGGSLQVLTPMPMYDRITTTDGLGRPYSVGLGGKLRVKLRRERIQDEAIIRKLRAVENHLQRGGHVMFAADQSRAFAAWIPAGTLAGQTSFNLTDNVFAPHLTAASVALAIASGDELVIESGNPSWRREQVRVSSFGAASVPHYTYTLGTSAAVVYDRPDTDGVLVRHKHAYPALYLPEGADAPLISDEHDALWTFEAELEMNAGIYTAGMTTDIDLVTDATTSTDPRTWNGLESILGPRPLDGAGSPDGVGLDFSTPRFNASPWAR